MPKRVLSDKKQITCNSFLKSSEKAFRIGMHLSVEKDLKTDADRWLYSLKHAQELTSQPAGIRGKIFDKLFETLEIKQLTEEQMETYNKSILKYRDVRSAVELAQERYFEKGIEKGIKTTAIKCIEEGTPVEMVCRVTGLTLEQISVIR